MNLLDLKAYLMKVKMTSLAALCTYFKSDADTLRQMLMHWVRKGCLRQCKKTENCGKSCNQCPSSMIEMYEWVV